jgi:hypothetical protein
VKNIAFFSERTFCCTFVVFNICLILNNLFCFCFVKYRNSEEKKTIRVQAKNLRDADGYSWRNKGTQWIKGLPFPRLVHHLS